MSRANANHAKSARGRPKRHRNTDTRRRVEEAAALLFTATVTRLPQCRRSPPRPAFTSRRSISPTAPSQCSSLLARFGSSPATKTLEHASARERRWAREVAAAPDPHAKLVRYVQQIADVSPRITPLLDVLRATAPAEADVATFLDEMERGRREGALQLLGHGTPPGTWQEGLTPARVADITFAIASPDTLRALTDRCGWTLPEAQELIVRTVEHELSHHPRQPTR